jgi:hypothetical protein
MHVFAQAFAVPKSGSTNAEYEDSFWPTTLQVENSGSYFRCAIADGATETSYSRVWADLLVRSICRKNVFDMASLLTRLPEIQLRWTRLVQRQLSRKPLPWFVEEKTRSGAAAAVLGFSVFEKPGKTGRDRTWRAIAVGDCCLIQVRDDEVVTRFPLSYSSEFTVSPYLISSAAHGNSHLRNYIQVIDGVWNYEDEFYLISDALAHWFLKSYENSQKPWHVLRDMGTVDQDIPFDQWVQNLRTSGDVRNDDTTLLRVTIAL